MQQNRTLRKHIGNGIGLIAFVALILVGCGGGGGSSSTNNSPTASQIAAITPQQIATYSDAQITSWGTNINSLSNAALGALTQMTRSNPNNLTGQIETISAAQLATLTPAQVRLIGSTDAYGATTTSKIEWLNSSAWAALASDPAQVSAITAAEITTLSNDKIVALGTNINALNNAALGALTQMTRNNPNNLTGQIQALYAAQLATLTPAQVRMIGSTDAYGATTTSKIEWLNASAWAVLAGDPAQVSAITAAEISTLSDDKIVALGTNINSLSDAALGALTPMTNLTTHPTGQVESIYAAQIATLTPAQVRLIGSTDAYGATTTSQIEWLNASAWAELASDPVQVSAITAAEITTLSDAKIVALGTHINSLSDAALSALSPMKNLTIHLTGQIESIYTAQLVSFTPVQIGDIAGTYNGIGIAYLNSSAFGSLSATQVAILTPANVTAVSATQLVSLTATAIGGLTPATIASLTNTQKSLLSPAQKTACGC